LVIWSECGKAAFDGNCFDTKWNAANHPLAILEWTVHRPGHPKTAEKLARERAWLSAYCQWQTSVLAYAILIDGRCAPRKMYCSRFLGSTVDNEWLELPLDS
jgi:hypothetical protein